MIFLLNKEWKTRTTLNVFITHWFFLPMNRYKRILAEKISREHVHIFHAPHSWHFSWLLHQHSSKCGVIHIVMMVDGCQWKSLLSSMINQNATINGCRVKNLYNNILNVCFKIQNSLSQDVVFNTPTIFVLELKLLGSIRQIFLLKAA